MSDETKGNPPSPQQPDANAPAPDKPVTADQQVAPTKAGVTQQGKDEASAKPAPPVAAPGADAVKPTSPPAADAKGVTPPEAAQKTAVPPAAKAAPPAAKPAAPAAAKPAAPAKPAGPTPQPWESALVTDLKRRFGSGIAEASTYLGQPYLVVDSSVANEILQILRDEQQFDYLVDVTAVHYPKREKQFDLVWILYSFAKNERIRVKTQIAETQAAPSAVPLWETANWLERECYDMFGIHFEGHPDLRRILLPDGWKGFPLRKDYGIIQQDKEWVKINLGIESGQ
jgi:NADH-quinone oxidoreductase subunit C